MKLTLLTPFFPFLFLFLNKIAIESKEIPILKSLNIGWPSTALWPMTCFYYGLIFLALASAIYYIFCPQEIRTHKTYQDYHEAESDFLTDKMIAQIQANLLKLSKSKRRIVIEENITSLPPNSVNKHDVIRNYYSGLNNTHYHARIFCGVFYILGLIFLFFPAVVRFFSVTKILFESIVNTS